ncbi:MAG: hypothetical protein ACT4PW_13590 [Acidimicrobiia bacterium]
MPEPVPPPTVAGDALGALGVAGSGRPPADEHGLRQAAVWELSDADRSYRAAFQVLTSDGGLAPSSFKALRLAVDRLSDALERLREPVAEARATMGDPQPPMSAHRPSQPTWRHHAGSRPTEAERQETRQVIEGKARNQEGQEDRP